MLPTLHAGVRLHLTSEDLQTAASNLLSSPEETVSPVTHFYNALNLTMSNNASPSDSPTTRTVINLGGQDANLRESDSGRPISPDRKRGYVQQNVSRKPELKFSIERILGLSSDSGRQTFQHENRYSEKQFVDDNHDHGDDDDDDDEAIDVDDTSTVVGHFGRSNRGDEYLSLSEDGDTPKYQWLQCTRYHPPKLQRNKKKDGTKKRKLGRNPRVPFTQHQVAVLEEKFRRTHYLSSMDVAELSGALSLTETRVKIWFQNRRARERREKEASQRNQTNIVQKAFQPLTIPSVSWPIPASMASANFVQYQNALDFRSNYLSSAFGLYASRDGRESTREASSSNNSVKSEGKTRVLSAEGSPVGQV